MGKQQIYISILLFIIIGSTAMAAPQTKTVFNFAQPKDRVQWMIINDTVMGGISQSRMEPCEAKYFCFTGSVSLENYGGFCSTRTPPGTAHNLSAYDGVTVRLKGDGKRYKLTLKTDATFNGFAYQFAFTSTKGEWSDIRAPFKDFVAVFRGQEQPNAAPLDPAAITTFGFLIADKQAGPFRLEIASIGAYKK